MQQFFFLYRSPLARTIGIIIFGLVFTVILQIPSASLTNMALAQDSPTPPPSPGTPGGGTTDPSGPTSPTSPTAPTGPSGGGISNPIKAQTFTELVEAIAKAITAIGIPLVAIFLVWAGFLFVTARGNEEQLKRAKTTFFWAIVGGAVIIGAWALAIAIVNFAKGLG